MSRLLQEYGGWLVLIVFVGMLAIGAGLAEGGQKQAAFEAGRCDARLGQPIGSDPWPALGLYERSRAYREGWYVGHGERNQ